MAASVVGRPFEGRSVVTAVQRSSLYATVLMTVGLILEAAFRCVKALVAAAWVDKLPSSPNKRCLCFKGHGLRTRSLFSDSASLGLGRCLG